MPYFFILSTFNRWPSSLLSCTSSRHPLGEREHDESRARVVTTPPHWEKAASRRASSSPTHSPSEDIMYSYSSSKLIPSTPLFSPVYCPHLEKLYRGHRDDSQSKRIPEECDARLIMVQSLTTGIIDFLHKRLDGVAHQPAHAVDDHHRLA